MKKYIIAMLCLFCMPVYATTVVATINGKTVTDDDITARVKLMARQGNTSTDNRRVALKNMIDDEVKLKYAANFGVIPSDKDVDSELKHMGLSGLSENEKNVAKDAIKANIAWQIIVARTILPMVNITNSDIDAEKAEVSRAHGLPMEVTMVRLVDVPDDIYKQLSKPKSCDNAVEIAENLGGVPQKFTALHYELSPDIRNVIDKLPMLTWSKPMDSSVFLVCSTKKTKEYGQLDKMLKQNAEYKQAMSMADQQLKQLRRKAVVVIKDDRYKL